MNVDLSNILNQSFWNYSLRELLIGVLTFLILEIALNFGFGIIRKRLESNFKHNSNQSLQFFIRSLNRLNLIFFTSLSIQITLIFFHFPDDWNSIITKINIIILTYFGVLVIQEFFIWLIARIVHRNKKTSQKFDPAAIGLTSVFIRVSVWLVAVIFISPNLGVNVSGLVASFGIGGIAIAFGMQNILADIFASLIIFFDKPFDVGDFIEVGVDKGFVRHIGLRSTRLRTPQGEELIISNRELTNSRIHNFKLLKKRRIAFELNIKASASPELLRQLPEVLASIIYQQKFTEFGRSHLKEIKAGTVVFETIYFINGSDYQLYMDIQQTILLEVLAYLSESKIELVV